MSEARLTWLPAAAVVGLIGGLAFSSVALAEKPEWRSWPEGERLKLQVGVFRPTLDTTVGIADSTGTIGAEINFEKNLNLEDTKSVPLIDLEWRISKRNTLRASYFNLDRSSFEPSSGTTIKLGDNEIDVQLPIESFFDIKAYELEYAFSAVRNKKVDFSIGLGLSIQELGFGIRGTSVGTPGGTIPLGDIVNETVELTAPLPTFNLGFSYAFNDKWIFDSRIGYLALELNLDTSEDLEGSIIDAFAGVRWKAFKYVGFTASYQIFDVDVDYQKRKAVGTLDYQYRGPAIGIEAFF